MNCTWKKPQHWLSVKWALLLLLCLKAIKHGTWKVSTAIHRMCRQVGQYVLVAWSGNNQGLCLCLWFPSLAFAWHVKSWTLPLYGFWLRLVRKCEYHHTDKENRSVIISKMIMRVCSFHHKWLWQSLSGGCNIISLLGWCDFITINKHSVC